MISPLPKMALSRLFTEAVGHVVDKAFGIEMPMVVVESPKQAAHGDYAVNTAMVLAKPLRRRPAEIAAEIIANLPDNEIIETAEIAGPGFINVRLKPTAVQEVARAVLKAGEDFGRNDSGRGRKVMVEFVSANPTGPLHVGHGRQGAIGDALSNVFAANGFSVFREFYYNDAGNQINNLTLSVAARARTLMGRSVDFPADGYHGDYIVELAQAAINAGIDIDDDDAVRRFAVAALRQEQDLDLKAFGVAFDRYYLESSLYDDGRVEKTVDAWQKQGKLYEQEGALWLKTTDYGDDKDRVVRKSDGGYTYFVPDVAYHVTKFERGFEQAVNVQGTDHFGTIARVRAGLSALDIGIPVGYPDYVLHSMVKVMRVGEEVKISKRAGGYVTLRDLIDEVGRDAVRFFLVSRKADSEFVFDIDLAVSKTEENPVFYIQYAHARICQVLSRSGMGGDRIGEASLASLVLPKERGLLLRLADYPERVATAMQELAPHLIAFYLKELASEFHAYYNAERVLIDDDDLRVARLALCLAVRQVIRNGMALLGVSSPETM